MNHRAALAGVLAVVLSAVAACSSSPATQPAAPTTGPSESRSAADPLNGFEPTPISWSRCGRSRSRSLECATLLVPLDWAEPRGDTIALALARRPAGDDRRRLGAIVTNPGGPGGSGVDTLRSSGVFDAEITARFDIVSFDPRGVGDSDELACGDTVATFLALDPNPDAPDEQVELDQAAQAVAGECEAEDARLLPHVGSTAVARDLEAIRRALGDDQLTYYGFSYGTLIGQLYAGLFPENIRAMVLDGVVDPRDGLTDFLRKQTTALQAALDRIAASCAEDPGCPVDGMKKAYDRLAATVDAEPLRVDAGGISRSVGPAQLTTAAIFATYGKPYRQPFLRALASAERGDGEGLLKLSDAYRSFGGFTLYTAVECVDSPHPEGAEAYQAFAAELDAISPRLGAAIANELLPCAYWPAAPTRQPGPVKAAGSPPILVVGNTGDAATPYAQAQRVAATLDAGVLLTYEGEGHTSYGKSDCVDRAVARYLVDLDPPSEGATCG